MHTMKSVSKKTSFYLMLLVALAQSASGNGGGYQYGIEFTGGVAPFEPTGVENVQILDEKLSIVIDDDEADVEVKYRMKHVGQERAPHHVRISYRSQPLGSRRRVVFGEQGEVELG